MALELLGKYTYSLAKMRSIDQVLNLQSAKLILFGYFFILCYMRKNRDEL